MFKLLFIIPIIAFIDPFILYWMWPKLNFWVEFGGLIVLPLIISIITTARSTQPGDFFTRPIRIATKIAAWYPGPICKIIAILLVIPAIERALIRFGANLFQQHILRGINTGGMSGIPGMPSMPGMPGNPKSSPFRSPKKPGDDNLKPTRGRIVD